MIARPTRHQPFPLAALALAALLSGCAKLDVATHYELPATQTDSASLYLEQPLGRARITCRSSGRWESQILDLAR